MKKATKTPRSIIQAIAGASLSSGFGMIKVNGKDVPADFDVAAVLQEDRCLLGSGSERQLSLKPLLLSDEARAVTLTSARGTARRRKPIDL